MCACVRAFDVRCAGAQKTWSVTCGAALGNKGLLGSAVGPVAGGTTPAGLIAPVELGTCRLQGEENNISNSK